MDNIFFFSPKCKEKNCPEIIKCNFHSTCYYKQLSVFFFFCFNLFMTILTEIWNSLHDIYFLFKIVYNSIVFGFLWRPSGSKYLDSRSPLLFVSCFFVILLIDPFIFIQNVQFLMGLIKKIFWMFDARKNLCQNVPN